MKTYNLLFASLAMVVIGCTKSDGDGNSTDKTNGVNSAYTLLVQDKEKLSSIAINVTGELSVATATESAFTLNSTPKITYVEDDFFSYYHQSGDCNGEITVYDFERKNVASEIVFEDLGACNLKSNAILRTENSLYIAYEIKTSKKISDYYVRAIDTSSEEVVFTDIALGHKPVEMAFANDRLFVLTLDEKLSGKYGINVIDAQINLLIYYDLLTFGARRIFKGPNDNIIVSFDDLHMTIDNNSLAVSTTKYGVGTEPNFKSASTMKFDASGRLYYDMPGGTHSIYPVISAVYDFEKNSAILYAYENFLSEAQRKFEFEIESTTMVSYDEKNDFILIGYKKIGSNNRGGLLRIKPAPNPALIDNLDVDGVPHSIFVE
ncbi:hypothetical protein [Pseudozobellia sp. WGM2]|uniref:hypothetical protein n=1 Tax=Pseudozobellia sp. WGM2 TaxID=2787625 RepID=UPI001AE0120A|nr:hypothetical protein [Pseudozobellia sp. WGM2]